MTEWVLFAPDNRDANSHPPVGCRVFCSLKLFDVNILLIDDDTRLAELLEGYFAEYGLRLTSAETAQEGLKELRSREYQLVLLDIMLPDGDGLEISKKIRSFSDVPIIMLTARGADEDKIIGLEIGADDYVAKPFNPRELIARIKAVARRRSGMGPDQEGVILEYQDFYLNSNNQILIVRGNEIALTSAEFKLLKVLASNPNRVFSRERLMDAVQGREFDGIDRTIDVHISKLRNKIEDDPKRPRWIKTIWGSGYRFQL
jgi:DNA-binding response OmpR family regulator